jgi:hypothetical protein
MLLRTNNPYAPIQAAPTSTPQGRLIRHYLSTQALNVEAFVLLNRLQGLEKSDVQPLDSYPASYGLERQINLKETFKVTIQKRDAASSAQPEINHTPPAGEFRNLGSQNSAPYSSLPMICTMWRDERLPRREPREYRFGSITHVGIGIRPNHAHDGRSKRWCVKLSKGKDGTKPGPRIRMEHQCLEKVDRPVIF